MFNNRDIVCAVEIGTSKICVLVGEVSGDGEVEVIGRGLVPGNGSVVKGEICNYPGLLPLLDTQRDTCHQTDHDTNDRSDNVRHLVFNTSTNIIGSKSSNSFDGCGGPPQRPRPGRHALAGLVT